MINLSKLTKLIEDLRKVTYEDMDVGLIMEHQVYGKYSLKLNPQQNAFYGKPLDKKAEYYWNNKFEKLSKDKQKERANEICLNSSTWNYVDEDVLVHLLVMDCGEWSAYNSEILLAQQVKELDQACYKANITREDFLSILKFYEPLKDKII